MRKASRPACFCQDRLERIPVQRMGPVRLKAVSALGQIPGAAVFHVTVPPRSRHDMIFHRRTREWFLVVKGRGRGVIGGRRVTFRPGVIVFMPPGVPHQMMTGSSSLEALVVFSPPLELTGRRADVHRA